MIKYKNGIEKYTYEKYIGSPCSSVVERLPCKQKVPCSIHGGGTIKN